MAQAQPGHRAEPAIAEAVADVAHAAQRIVEERIELLRLEVRDDMGRILKASALGASGVVALAVAVGLAAASITWTLALWVPFGAALAITAVVTAGVGVVLSYMAKTRLPHRSSAEDSLPGEGEGTKAVSQRERKALQAEREVMRT